MSGQVEVWRRTARLERLMAKKLRLRSGSLADRAAKARRDLPRAVRRDLETVSHAAHLAGHPRIARQIDHKAVDQAFRRASAHLTGPALKELKVKRRLGWLAGLLVNVTLIILAFGGLVWWQGGI